MIIVAIDPGSTTGVCIIREQPSVECGFQVVSVWQIPWEQRTSFFMALFNGTFATDNGKPLLPEIVVIEAFRLRPGRAMEQVGSIFPSVRIIGIIEAFIEISLPKPLMVFQEPSVIGRVEVLPEHKEALSGLIHATAAYMHARYYHLTTGS
jgi:hypothetical protein